MSGRRYGHAEQGASAQLLDHVSGRLRITSPQPTASTNFHHPVLKGGILPPGKVDKKCLHWAAQFGNLRFTLTQRHAAGSQGKLTQYINQLGSDGWTPLCWVACL